jgi:5-methyltetrahydropteroyltriglutamate--homocysteine methyltransferase
LINPDCGFATFADNPVTSASVAEAKLANMVRASEHMRTR